MYSYSFLIRSITGKSTYTILNPVADNCSRVNASATASASRGGIRNPYKAHESRLGVSADRPARRRLSAATARVLPRSCQALVLSPLVFSPIHELDCVEVNRVRSLERVDRRVAGELARMPSDKVTLDRCRAEISMSNEHPSPS